MQALLFFASVAIARSFYCVNLDDKGRVMQESVALDTSHESGRGTTHLSSPEPGAEKEEFSDWDSWEDENEVGLDIVLCCLTNQTFQRTE